MGEWRMDQVGEPKTAAPETARPSAGQQAPVEPPPTVHRSDRTGERHRPAHRPRRRKIVAVVMLALLVAGAAFGAYTLMRDQEPVTLADVPLIRADHTPVRLRPEEPGGIDVPHLDRAVMHDTDAGDAETEIGAIAPPPEEPVERPAPTVAEADPPAAPAMSGAEAPDPPSEAATAAGDAEEPLDQADAGTIESASDTVPDTVPDTGTAPGPAADTPEALIDRVTSVAEADASAIAPGANVEQVAAIDDPAAVADAPAPTADVASEPESLLPEDPVSAAPSDPPTGQAAPDAATDTATDATGAVPDAPAVTDAPSEGSLSEASPTGDETEAVAAGPAGPFLAAELGVPADRMAVDAQPVAAAPPAEPIPPRSEGENRIQVAAVDSETVARQEWLRFQQQYPEILGDLQLFVTTVEVNGRLFYRIQGGLLTDAEARERCQSLQDLGADCIVR